MNDDGLRGSFAEIKSFLDEDDVALLSALEQVRAAWQTCHDGGGCIWFAGNGGSAAISSHMATDLSKNGKLRARAFNDASLLTCLSNDYGYENWLKEALRQNAAPGDCLVAISSSGQSENMLRGADLAKELDMRVITFTGMQKDNGLKQAGDINLWCDSRAYNVIETVHLAWISAVVDLVIGKRVYSA